MNETPAMRQFVLTRGGEDAEFADFTIRVLVGQELQKYSGGESSIYQQPKIKYTFQFDSVDIQENSVTRGMQFSVTLEDTIFTFQILDLIPDLTGWITAEVDLLSQTNV